MTKLGRLMTLAICLALLTGAALAADIEVNADCSLAAAITAANTDEASDGCPAGDGADIITLTADITLDAALPDISSELRIEGAGYAISGAEQFRIFLVETTGALTLHEATLIDGVAQPVGVTFVAGSEPSLRERGGAIFNLGSLHVISSQFSNNSAVYYGGALWNHWESAGMSVEDSIFTDNSAGRSGGAIDNLGSATVSGSQFVGNEAESGAAVFVLDDGDIVITDSQFEGNEAGDNGGALVNRGIAEISDSVFSANTAALLGGAIANDGVLEISDSQFSEQAAGVDGGALHNKGALSILDSQFADNTASIGAALANYGSLEIASSEFTGNAASVTGGAIMTYDETVIISSLFSANSADADGGAIHSAGVLALVEIVDSHFEGNAAGCQGGAIFQGLDAGGAPIGAVTLSGDNSFRDNLPDDCANVNCQA